MNKKDSVVLLGCIVCWLILGGLGVAVAKLAVPVGFYHHDALLAVFLILWISNILGLQAGNLVFGFLLGAYLNKAIARAALKFASCWIVGCIFVVAIYHVARDTPYYHVIGLTGLVVQFVVTGTITLLATAFGIAWGQRTGSKKAVGRQT